MAISIETYLRSIILRMDSITRIYKDSGFNQFAKEFLTIPQKCTDTGFSSDNYFYSRSYIKKGAHESIAKVFGHDGQLVFISYGINGLSKLQPTRTRLNSKGFIEGLDYYCPSEDDESYNKDDEHEKDIIDWFALVDEEEGLYKVYSIAPFIIPIKPSKFPCYQGGIYYETELHWDLAQQYIQKGEYNSFSDIIEIANIYSNCSIKYRKSYGCDDWFHAYKHEERLNILGNFEYNILRIIGTCFKSCNFIPLYKYINDKLPVRMDKDKVELPLMKSDFIRLLTELAYYYKENHIEPTYNIRYEYDTYVGYIDVNIKKRICIYVNENKICGFWMIKKKYYIPIKESSLIMKHIAENWSQRKAMDTEQFLSDNFEYTMYGSEEIFGCHKLSKRQYLIWLNARFEVFEQRDINIRYIPHKSGITCILNKDIRYIQFYIQDGMIFRAEEIDPPSTVETDAQTD